MLLLPFSFNSRLPFNRQTFLSIKSFKMASTIKFSLTLFTVLLACTVYDVQAQKQQITLYDGLNQVGQSLTIVAKNVLDLKFYSFQAKARSACLTGAWLLYTRVYYNEPQPSAEMEYYFGNNKCVNLKNPNGIYSLRYVGSGLDYKESSITFYLGNNFMGEEAYVDRDLPVLNWNGKGVSFIITGDDSWAIYDQPNYQGNSVCIIPPRDDQPYLVSDTNSLNIPHNLFRSIKKGCATKDEDDINNAAATAARGWNGFTAITTLFILWKLIRNVVQLY